MDNVFKLDENGVSENSAITYPFPYSISEMDLSSYSVPWHWHEEIEFDYASKGSIIVETVNHIYTIQQGEAYFVNTNVLNTKRKAEDCSTAVECAHLFHPILLTGHYRSVYETKYLNPILHNMSLDVLIFREDTESGREFLKVLHTLVELNQQESTEFQVRSLLSQAWLALMQEAEIQKRRQGVPSTHLQERAKEILSFIHQHYQDKITIADIAAYANVSTRECIRSFKSAFHQTPMNFLIRYRIEQAKRLLKETDDPITDIALLTGFQNNAYFSKTFKRYLNMTPKEYRSSTQTDS